MNDLAKVLFLSLFTHIATSIFYMKASVHESLALEYVLTVDKKKRLSCLL